MKRASCLAGLCALALVLVGCDDVGPRARGGPTRSAGTAVTATPGKAAAQAPSAEAQPPSAEAADEAALRVVGGAELRAEIAKSGRKATLVNLWASWCGSCKREIPMLLEVQSGMQSEGLGLVLVSADEPSSRPRAVELLREHDVPLPSHALGGGVESYRRALDPRWEGAIPATFLLDATAKVRYFWNGPVLAHEITPIVQGMLAGQNIDGMTDYAAPRAQ